MNKNNKTFQNNGYQIGSILTIRPYLQAFTQGIEKRLRDKNNKGLVK